MGQCLLVSFFFYQGNAESVIFIAWLTMLNVCFSPLYNYSRVMIFHCHAFSP